MASPLTVNMTYTIMLTPHEFRVVMACLRAGAEDTEIKAEWRPEAATIQDKLFRARNTQVTEQLSAIRKLTDENESEEKEKAEDRGASIEDERLMAAAVAKNKARSIHGNHPGGRHGTR